MPCWYWDDADTVAALPVLPTLTNKSAQAACVYSCIQLKPSWIISSRLSNICLHYRQFRRSLSHLFWHFCHSFVFKTSDAKKSHLRILLSSLGNQRRSLRKALTALEQICTFPSFKPIELLESQARFHHESGSFLLVAMRLVDENPDAKMVFRTAENLSRIRNLVYMEEKAGFRRRQIDGKPDAKRLLKRPNFVITFENRYIWKRRPAFLKPRIDEKLDTKKAFEAVQRHRSHSKLSIYWKGLALRRACERWTAEVSANRSLQIDKERGQQND